VDFQQELVRTRSMKTMDLKDVFILNKIRYDVFIMYERILLYINSFEVFMLYILMYPVLDSTYVLDFLDTSSMGVTFGIRARSIQTVPWVIKLQLR
jgi:hypothetical protein